MTKNIVWPFIILSYLALLCHAMIDNSRGAVYPFILDHFGIPKHQGALIFSLSTITGLFISATSKHWLKVIGTVRSLLSGIVMVLVASLLYYFVPENHYSYNLFLLSSIVLGSGISIIAIGMNILVSEGCPPELRRKGYSGLHAVYGFGSLITPLIFSFWSEYYQWNSFFLILAIIPSIPLLYYLFSFIEKELPPQKETTTQAPVSLLSRIGIGFMFGFYVASEVVISSRLVLYLKEGMGFENQRAQLYLSGFFLFLFLGRLGFVFVSKNVSTILSLHLSLLSSLVFVLLGLFVSPIFLTLTGLSMSFFFPVAMEWLNEKFIKSIDFMTGSVFTWIAVCLAAIHYFFGLIANFYTIKLAIGLGVALIATSWVLFIFYENSLEAESLDH